MPGPRAPTPTGPASARVGRRRGRPRPTVRRMTILAIDAGTTGVTALIVDRGRPDRGPRLPRVPPALPRRRVGRARPRRDLGGRDRRGRRGARPRAERRRGRAQRGRHHQPARDGRALGPRDPRQPRAGRSCGRTGAPPGMCEQLRADGHEDRVAALTGLRLDPYFSATKLAWIAANEPHVWAGVRAGRVAVGTVDSYLMARMTRGLRARHRRLERLPHAAVRHAHRRLVRRAVRAVRRAALGAAGDRRRRTARSGAPTRRRSSGSTCRSPGSPGTSRPRCSARRCFAVGTSKCTYGTGSFVLVNTGTAGGPVQPRAAHARWPGSTRTAAATYALEGAVFVTGAAVQWLRDGLGIIERAADSEALARSVPDSGGVVFVPALTGLGAPDWDPTARGAILGHHPRHDAGAPGPRHPGRDRVPGPRRGRPHGARGRRRRCRRSRWTAAPRPTTCCASCRPTSSGCRCCGPRSLETTGLGAAFLAGLGTGVWSSTDEIAATWRLDQRFEPGDPRRGRAPPLAVGGRPGEGLGPRGLTARGVAARQAALAGAPAASSAAACSPGASSSAACAFAAALTRPPWPWWRRCRRTPGRTASSART